MVIKEKSCGAVVYYLENGQVLYLIEEMQKGHLSIPKGHVENNETEIETAEREILEETGLKLKVDTKFRQVISYSPYEGCIKDVVFFVAQTKNKNTKCQESEVKEIFFYPYEIALQKLTYDSDKETLKKANSYILKNS